MTTFPTEKRRITNAWINLLTALLITGLFMSLKEDGYVFETATIIYYGFFLLLYTGIVLIGITAFQEIFLRLYNGKRKVIWTNLSGLPGGIIGLYLFMYLLRAVFVE